MHLPPVQDHEPVADWVSVVRVVRDEDHRDAAVARLEDVAQHDARLLHAERRRRLVEDQHPRSEMHCASDRDGLPLAARERPDRLIRVADVDTHLRELAPDGRARLRGVEEPKRPDLFIGSAPRKKFRQIDISGTIARSW